MSLIEPIVWQKYRIWIIAAGCLFALLVLLWIVQSTGNWSFKRGQNKLKTNANLALQEIANTKEQIANLKQVEAAQIANVNHAVKELQEASNVSDEARKETDKALEQLNNVNVNGNVSVQELEAKLKDL